MKHELKAIPLDKLENNNWENFTSIRSLERGSKLVISFGPIAVFQMPRGNLEVIHPRILAIRIIKTYLDETRYGCAFEIIRRQRINLNLIVDHDYELFYDNIDKFVAEMKDDARICLFISDLS